MDKNKKTKVQPIQDIKPGSEQHKKLRDIRLKYGAGSKEYKEVALGVQEKQSTEMKEDLDEKIDHPTLGMGLPQHLSHSV